MSHPRISICIPTYNRREYLGETIGSLLDQIVPETASQVEICISDNASTDGTDDLVAEIQSRTPVRIVYSRNETNIGPDANYLRAVQLASGDYCWFMGSDDIVVPDSVKTFLREVDEGHDIYLCNRVDCDIKMVPMLDRHWLDRSVVAETFDFANPAQFERYTRLSRSVGALFSYLSCIVFKRDKWTAIQIDPVFIGSAYSHVYMLLSFIKTGCVLKYLPEQLVRSRGYNDSFLDVGDDGVISRIMLDIRGYSLLADRLFSDAPAHRAGVLRVLHAERPALNTLPQLRFRADHATWTTIAAACRKAGYSPAWLSFVGASKPLMRVAKQMRDRVRAAA